MGGAALLRIAPDAPALWWIDLDDPVVRALAETAPPLAGEAAGFARHADAGERLLRRRLARLMLAAAAGTAPGAVAVARTALGAPVVTAPAGWHLSVAARWPACLLGVATAPLGVDLERVGEPLPDDLLTADERRLDARLDPRGRAAASARRWAMKEAHAKGTGRPRDLDPAAIETARAPLVSSRLGRTRCWTRTENGLVAAVSIAA